MAAPQLKTPTRDLILDAADRILARFGFRKMTMDDLAAEARVSKRTIYLYFQSKEDVGLSSIERTVAQVFERMRDAASRAGNPRDALQAMLRERVMGRVLAVQGFHQGLDQLFEVVRPAYLERRRTMFDTEIDLIASVIDTGIRDGSFTADDPRSAAESLLLATNAFIPYGLSVEELGRPQEIERRLYRMIDLLLNGLAKR